MNHKIVFFDGVCNFCNTTVNYIWDHNPTKDIYFSSLQSNFAKDFFNQKGIDITDLSTLYYFEDDKLYQKSDAIVYISKNLTPSLQFWGKALAILPKFLRDFGYTVFSKNRYLLFGKSNTCRVPTSQEKEHFLV